MKKINENTFDSYANMGQMGTEQEMNTNEETKGIRNRIGVLVALVAYGISGKLNGEEGLKFVMENPNLSDETKEQIQQIVDDLTQHKNGDIGDVQIGDENELMESEAIKKIRENFKRFL